MARNLRIPPVSSATQRPREFTRAEKDFKPFASEPFQLTMEKVVTGEELVKLTQIFGWRRLRFRGQELANPLTHKFRFVRPGWCGNIEELRSKLREYGKVPSGVWIVPAHQRFGRWVLREKYVGIADPSWESPNGEFFLPIMNQKGVLDFRRAGIGFGIGAGWLVQID